MNVIKGKAASPSLPIYTAIIELEPEEAAKLKDLMGCDIDIPEKVFGGIHAQKVKALMNDLFTQLNDIGFKRQHADWSK